jgi:hypothetical protein
MRVVSARARALVSVAKRLSRIMIGEYGVRPEWHSARLLSFVHLREYGEYGVRPSFKLFACSPRADRIQWSAWRDDCEFSIPARFII